MTMADTSAVMNKGEIEQMGAPEELYELPRTAFVANFLGQSNLFTGPVTSSKGDTLVVEIAGRKVSVPRERAQRHAGEVTIGVRPEKVAIVTAEPKDAAGLNVVGPGRVVDVSFSGGNTILSVDYNGAAGPAGSGFDPQLHVVLQGVSQASWGGSQDETQVLTTLLANGQLTT